jgi:hypothetical protein
LELKKSEKYSKNEGKPENNQKKSVLLTNNLEKKIAELEN